MYNQYLAAMRIIILLNECWKFLIAVILLSLTICQVGYADVAESWAVSTGPAAALQINFKNVLVSQALKVALRNAELAAVLPVELKDDHAKSMRWLVVRQASRKSAGVGYCGAGNEDHLFLIKLVKSSAVIADDFLAQSCLKSISMDVEKFDDLLGSIKFDEQQRKLNFCRSISRDSESFRQDVVVFISRGRMSVRTQKVID